MPFWDAYHPEAQDAVSSALRRALVVSVDDSGDQQVLVLSGLAGDQPQSVGRVQSHGFSSNPPKDAWGIFKALGGRSDRPSFIGGEHPQYRPRNLPSGNAILYDDKGNVVWMQGGSGVTIQTKAGPIAITSAATVTMSAQGDIIVNPNGAKVYLGGDPAKHIFAKVMTENGASPFVFARIG